MTLATLLGNILSYVDNREGLKQGHFTAYNNQIDFRLEYEGDLNIDIEKLQDYLSKQQKLQEYIQLVESNLEQIAYSDQLIPYSSKKFQDWMLRYGHKYVATVKNIKNVDDELYHMLDRFINTLTAPNNEYHPTLIDNLRDTLKEAYFYNEQKLKELDGVYYVK